MSVTALLDGDVLTYRCGFAVETTEYKVWVQGEDVPRISSQYKKDAVKWAKECLGEDVVYSFEKLKHIEPVENALHIVKSTIEAVCEETNADGYITALSPDTTFRHRLATIKPYKGNRDPENKPVHYKAIRDYLVARHNPVIIEDIEADDVMGIMQDEGTVICTIDKDLDMIPGDHYNFVTKERYWVTPDDAMYCFYKQVLMGDRTDNIQGIPGMGEKGASALLEGLQPEQMEEVVRQAYLTYSPERGLQEFEETKKLLWILREPLSD